MVLLLSLAATSIVGTLIPQNASPEAYFREYGESLYRLFDLLDFFDMYHSWWFQFLILLLMINIVVCSLDRISATWKIVFAKNPIFNLSRYRKLDDKAVFEDERPLEELKQVYQPFVARRFAYSRLEPTKKGFCIFAEKWRWTRLGVYTVHLSIVFLLIGSLIGSIFGFEGYVNIPEGEAVGSVRLRNTGEAQSLDFDIRCENFDLSFYDNGAPKEYRSSLTILEQGKPVLKKDIIVNDPLRYKGINIFQSSYGKMPSDPRKSRPKMSAKDFSEEITLNFVSLESGMKYQEKAEIGKPMDIPGGHGKFVLTEFKEAAQFRGQNIGEALVGILTPADGAPIEVLLPLHFPNFDRMRRGAVIISVADQTAESFHPDPPTEERYYTGLQVTKDPGVWVVYTGFMIMIIGCYITFFMSHQRYCIEVVKRSNKSQVIVTGQANKNKLGIPSKIKKISERLAGL
ncbi:cytochrome c biogenesis protein ResB [Thermodesulfobacteriota bacterium]